MKRNKKWDSKEAGELYQAILKLKTLNEVKSFFRDLCTPEEIIELADRFQAAKLLEKGLDYRDIAARLGMSTTTVGRVAQWLWNGMGGYKTALARLNLVRHHTTLARGER